MALLPCKKCGKITTQHGSWLSPMRVLCEKCSKEKEAK